MQYSWYVLSTSHTQNEVYIQNSEILAWMQIFILKEIDWSNAFVSVLKLFMSISTCTTPHLPLIGKKKLIWHFSRNKSCGGGVGGVMMEKSEFWKEICDYNWCNPWCFPLAKHFLEGYSSVFEANLWTIFCWWWLYQNHKCSLDCGEGCKEQGGRYRKINSCRYHDAVPHLHTGNVHKRILSLIPQPMGSQCREWETSTQLQCAP